MSGTDKEEQVLATSGTSGRMWIDQIRSLQNGGSVNRNWKIGKQNYLYKGLCLRTRLLKQHAMDFVAYRQ